MAGTREAAVASRAESTSEALFAKLTPGPGRSATEVTEHQRARIHGAMLEIIAKRGYHAIRVREIAELAGISTRAFYKHFASKEECFLRTHETIVRRAEQGLVAAQVGERDRLRRLQLMLLAFVGQLKDDPASARLTLVECYLAGPGALQRACRAEETVAATVAACIARAPGGVPLPPLVVEGLLGGVARVARTRLLDGQVTELERLEGELLTWSARHISECASRLPELDRGTVWRDTTLAPSGRPPRLEDGGDRALLVSAAADLAAAGNGDLTASRLRAAAGVPRSAFDANFASVEECLLEALEQRATEAIAEATRAQAAARTTPGGVYRAIAALCARVASDPFLADACVGVPFLQGPHPADPRSRVLAAVAERLTGGIPRRDQQTTPLVAEATAGAVWSLFHRQLVGGGRTGPGASATLAYMALSPAIGPETAIAAIQREQWE